MSFVPALEPTAGTTERKQQLRAVDYSCPIEGREGVQTATPRFRHYTPLAHPCRTHA